MISLAMNTYAFLFLSGVGLLATILFGAAAFFGGRAVRRSLRTMRWKPEIGDKVISRRAGFKGTVDRIDGQKILVGYYTPNNMARQSNWFDRAGFFFESRPVRR